MNQTPGPPQGQPPGGQRPGSGQGQYGQGQGQYGQPQQDAPPTVYGQNPHGQPPSGGSTGWGSYASTEAMPASRSQAQGGTPAVVTLARVLLGIAAAAALAYAVFAILALRGVYNDFDSADATLGEVQDRLDIHNIAVWVVVAVAALAGAAWIVSLVTARRGGGGLGLGGLAVTVVGAAVAVYGFVRMTGADNGDDAATGALIAGIGCAVAAVGLIFGLLALRGGVEAEAARGPYGGASGQQAPYAAGPYGQGQQGQGGQYGQSPPGYNQAPGSYGQQPGQQPGQPPYGGAPGR